jgi:hypothetical protein
VYCLSGVLPSVVTRIMNQSSIPDSQNLVRSIQLLVDKLEGLNWVKSRRLVSRSVSAFDLLSNLMVLLTVTANLLPRLVSLLARSQVLGGGQQHVPFTSDELRRAPSIERLAAHIASRFVPLSNTELDEFVAAQTEPYAFLMLLARLQRALTWKVEVHVLPGVRRELRDERRKT